MADRTKRCACYCMTRNIYHKIVPALKSLLINGKPDKVYIIAEDDDIGFDLPDSVEVINVSDQKFFPPDGPNYKQHWTYMALMRIALCHILPETVDKVLALDIDTIVIGNINDIWEAPISDCYFAGVKETRLSDLHGYPYINGGVILWNLKKMRDGMADAIIRELNTNKYNYPEQDAMNKMCRGHVYELSNAYNSGKPTVTGRHPYPRILHYADRPTYFDTEPEVQKYKDITWEECK